MVSGIPLTLLLSLRPLALLRMLKESGSPHLHRTIFYKINALFPSSYTYLTTLTIMEAVSSLSAKMERHLRRLPQNSMVIYTGRTHE